MDRKTANREWREVTRGAPEGAPTGRAVHAFARRVEEVTITRLYHKHGPALTIGSVLATMAFSLAQRVGQPISARDVELLDKLRREWARAVNAF